MIDETKNVDAQVIVDTAQAAVEPHALEPTDGLVGIVVPAGATHKVVDLEQYLIAPNRAKGLVTTQRVEDFVRYVERHDEPGSTTIWIDSNNHVVVGVLNDHGKDDAQWGDHRVKLQLQHTPEWLHWEKYDGKMLDQTDFAEHIEIGLDEIVDPDGATMLELAQSISGSTDATFKSTRRLDNGSVAIAYVEETQAAAGKSGDIEIPKMFQLSVAPFFGEGPAPLFARFRYSVRQGDLRLGYKLERPWKVIEETIDRIALNLDAKFTGRVFVGSPRS